MRKIAKKAVALLAAAVMLAMVGTFTGCSSSDFVIGETVYGKTLLQVTQKGSGKTTLKAPNGAAYISVNAA